MTSFHVLVPNVTELLVFVFVEPSKITRSVVSTKFGEKRPLLPPVYSISERQLDKLEIKKS